MLTTRLRTSLTAAAASAAVLACAAPSIAAERHATPNGSGEACTVPQPCSLETAMDLAVPNDEVLVHAGSHEVVDAGATERNTKRNLYVHPAPGAGRPEVVVTGDDCGLQVWRGSIVESLKIKLVAPGGAGLCTYKDTTARKLAVTGSVDDAIGIRAHNAEGT